MNRYCLLTVLIALLVTGCATPKSQSAQSIKTITPIKQVDVQIMYEGGVFYKLKVNNALPYNIRLLWDESTYVTTDGKAVRILGIDNRLFLPEHAPAQQRAASIAAGDTFSSTFTGEEWLECARRNCAPKPRDSTSTAKIILAFEIKGKRSRWLSEVTFHPVKK